MAGGLSTRWVTSIASNAAQDPLTAALLSVSWMCNVVPELGGALGLSVVYDPKLWNCKIKRRTVIFHRLYPDSTPMALNNTINRCQPYAGSFEFIGGMQPLKRFE